ncbi:MAG: methyltransferase [Geobacteraceae bacterium]|nr:methyltransferase [Geobacteraceae bacterium]
MESKHWTPEELVKVSNSYWSSCAIHAGVKLDLFTPLSACPHTAGALADLLEADERGLTMLLNALAALGLLEKNGEEYAATSFSAEFLARASPGFLGHIVRHHHNLMFQWARLDVAVRTGKPVRERCTGEKEEQSRESFEMGMFNLATLAAPLVVPHIDLRGCRSLLDLGGGPGTYSIYFCGHNPGLVACVFDLPSTRRFAEDTIASFGLSEKISFMPGDYLEDPIPGGHDAAWLSHILHAEGPGECVLILGKVAAALQKGGRIYVQEFILNDTMDGPLQPALFSLNMLTGTAAGQVYSEGQIKEMLVEAGYRDLRRIPVSLPNGAGIIAGTVT